MQTQSDSTAPTTSAGRYWRIALWCVLAVLGLVACALLLLQAWVLPNVDRWRPQIESVISQRLGVPVRIESLAAHLEGLSPALAMGRFELDNGQLLAVRGVAAVIDWRGLFRGRLRFQELIVDHAGVSVERLAGNRWRIGGRELPAGGENQIRSEGAGTWQLPDWLTKQGNLSLADLSVRYIDHTVGDSFVVSGMQIRAIGYTKKRRIAVRIPAIKGLSGPGSLQASLRRKLPDEAATGAIGTAQWDGQVFLELGALDLARVSSFLRGPVRAGAGYVDVRGWTDISTNSLQGARVAVSARDLLLRANDAEVMLPTAEIDLDLEPRPSGGMRLSARKAWATDRQGTRIEIGRGAQTLAFDRHGRPVLGQFSLGHFDATRVIAFARELPFPADMRALMRPLRASGRIDSLSLWFDASTLQSRYELQAAFSKLTASYRDPEAKSPNGVQWDPRLPGFENISGSVSITEREGALDIDTEDAVVDFPGVFAEPRIDLDRLRAQVSWRVLPSLGQYGDGRVPAPPVIDVTFHELDFANAHGKGLAKGRFRTVPNSLGEIDLSAQLADLDMRHIDQYLPLTMIPKVRAWFAQALRGGRSDRASLVLRGNLRDFPFRADDSGEFDLKFAVRNGRLRYGPDWPELTGFWGDVRLRRGGMSARLERGKVRGMPVSAATAQIANFLEPVLEINGQINGEGADLIGYFNDSPLKQLLGGFTAGSRIDGQVQTNLALALPLDDFTQFTLTGSARLDGARVQVSPDLPRFDDVRGEIQFSEIGLAFEGVKARVFDGPVSVKATSPRRKHFEMRLEGRLPAKGLQRAFDNPVTRRLTGSTRYRASVSIRDGQVRFGMRSNLAGLVSTLPAPFEKAASTAALLRVRLEPRIGSDSRVLGDRLQVRLRDDMELIFDRAPVGRRGDWRVRRGVLAVGQTPVLPSRGLAVQGMASVVDADAWSDFIFQEVVPFASTSKGVGGYFEGFDLRPSTVSLVAETTRFAFKDFNDVVVGASRQQDKWRVNLGTREVDGFVAWEPDARAGKLSARFSKLHVPPDAVGTIRQVIEDPAADDLPAMDIRADDFRLSDIPLGKLRVIAQRESGRAQWNVERLSMELPSARLAASGRWADSGNNRPQAQLDFDIDLRDAGELLGVMGFPDTVAGGSGKVVGRLAWAGSPLRLDKPSLNGTVTVSVQRGQFLKAEPGIAKLIGVLSLQSIPRRLNLDFSDVFEKGFAFDAIVGEAVVSNGVAQTDSLLMQGVQAQVLIKGEADIANETQKLAVDVLPNINAGIASIAYAAIANPAVGIGTLLAQLLLEQPLRRIFAYQFEITGPWSDPAVEQINQPDFDESEQTDYISG